MKRQKLLNKRILALALSAAMVFAQADSYAVMAAAPEISGEEVEYDESQAVLTEDLETGELGTEESESEKESGLADESTAVGEPNTEGTVDSDTADSDTVGDADSEDGDAESSDDTKETEETELPEEVSEEEPSEDEQENNIAEVNKDEAEESGGGTGDDGEPVEIVASGKVNDISWSVDADGLLLIEGTGDYISSYDLDYLPPWTEVMDIKSAKVDVSGITSTRNMFRYCEYMNSVDLSKLDTSNVTDMSYMFSRCYSLKSLDFSNFDTSNVTNMSYMFYDCYEPGWGLQTLDLSSFDTSKVTDMSGMFNDSWHFAKLDLSNFDTGNVTNMKDMFRACSWMNSLNISSFNTSKVTDMSGMFAGCQNLRSLDVSNFDTSKVTDMNRMFTGFSRLDSVNSLDLSNFDTSNVTDMGYMFYYSSSLNSLNISSFNTSKVTNMEYMFYACHGLTSLDLSNFDTGNVTNMAGMFNGCLGLTSLDVSGFNTENVINMSYMFSARDYTQDPEWHRFTSLDLSNFDTSNVVDMSNMFSGCELLSSLDISSFDTSKVTDMSYMFYNCRSLKSVDVSSFDTSNVRRMDRMFSAASHTYNNACKEYSDLASLDLSNFDTRNVTDMSSMFYNCVNLTMLDVSSFDTRNVTSMTGMFADCANLTMLEVSSFDTSNVRYMSDMFYNCANLTMLDLSSFDMGNVLAEYRKNIIDATSSLTYLCTPLNCDVGVELPISNEGSDKWYDEEGNTYTELPNLDHSIVLYKNGYPGGVGSTKKVVFISGITIEDKYYDGTPISYTGTPVVVDSSKNEIAGVILSASYTGTLADGSKYTQTTQPPSQIGNYVLSFESTESNSYVFSQASYRFNIKPAVLTITAPSPSIKIGETLPALSSLTATVEGLLDGEALTVQPQLKYGTDNIPTNVAGTYDIIPYGADAGNNYSINYVNGTLTITASGETPGEEPGKEPEIVHEGSSQDEKLKWTIDDAGKLIVKGTGNYPTSKFGYWVTAPDWCNYASSIKSAKIDISGITTTRYMFYDCDNLESIEFTNFDTSKVTDMYGMFFHCFKLTSLDVSCFDTSRVTNMMYMFSGCSRLTSLDLSSFNTKSVTDMSYMFSECFKLTSLNVSRFNTSSVTDMYGMFRGCSSLTSLDVSGFNTSNVTDIWLMFADCSSLTSLDVSNFNTSNVVDMDYMFSGCSSLTSLNVSSFNTSKVWDMAGMFEDCSSLTSLDVSSFNTGNVESMDSMFAGCSSLTNLDLSNFNTRKLKYIGDMFSGCSSLTSLDLSSFDMSKVKYEDDEDKIYDGAVSDVLKDCNSLSYIRTPKNCPEGINIILPAGASGTDKWYQALDTQCTILPIGLSDSIDLYKNGYPGDGTTKKAAFISGISINNMVYSGQNARYFGTVVLVDSDKNKITDEIISSSYTYTGTLADGSDYPETIQGPTEAGNYKLAVNAESKDYSAQALYSFRIEPKTVIVSAESVSIEINEALPELTTLAYTVSGLLGNDELTVAPTFKYSENIISTASAGCYGIIPSGALAGNNYRIEYEEGILTVGDPDDDSSFETDERNGLDLSSLSCTIAPVKARIYNGTAYEPTVKVTVTENGKKKKLAEGTDYRVLYKNNVNAGTGTVIVRGSGIYKGFKEAPIIITPKAVKKLKIVTGGIAGTISADDVNNAVISLPVYVYDGSKSLTRGKDYTLTYDSVKKGTLTVKVTGMDGSNYTGETKAKIAVYEGASADKIINSENVNLKSYTEKYTGKAIKPAVEVRINGDVISNKNYKVQYQNNKNAGTAYVIVTGKGAYKGKVVTAFEITTNPQSLNITNTIKAQTYKGKLLKPSVTVKAGNKKLKKNTDYVVTYKNNLHAGTATVTVTGKGNYRGTATKTFTINPLKASKISVKGTWKDSNGDGVKDGGALTVTYGKRLLKEGVDYTLEAGEIKKNKIKITVKGAEDSDFTGSVVKTLKME